MQGTVTPGTRRSGASPLPDVVIAQGAALLQLLPEPGTQGVEEGYV